MSLIAQDITQNEHPIIYLLTTKEDNKQIGIYTNLSVALKNLYLADEPAQIWVNYLNHKPKPHINDTYDCLIGIFYFNEDNLTYKRNLTGEEECVSEKNTLIEKDDFMQIRYELDQIELAQKKKCLNDYHTKAHAIVDKAIIQKFNQLSALLTYKLNKQIKYMNENYEMNFEYDLMYKANQIYQDSNEKLHTLTLEEKVVVVSSINKLIESVNDELTILKDLNEEFGEVESNNEKDDWENWEDWGNWLELETGANAINTINKNQGIGKPLYSSPPPTPPKLNVIPQKMEIKLRDQCDKPKKSVDFNLDQNVYYDVELNHKEDLSNNNLTN